MHSRHWPKTTLWGPKHLEARAIKEGTLVIQIVDAKTTQAKTPDHNLI